jgi:hypothetical protein
MMFSLDFKNDTLTRPTNAPSEGRLPRRITLDATTTASIAHTELGIIFDV